MTTARQPGKPRRRLGILLGLVFAAGMLSPATSISASEPVVSDRNSGVAISGVDPVAYFTDGKPIFGRPELELRQGGAVWRFRNEGNRAAFAARPDVYRPRFGGYDPVAIARDRSVAGHPLIWTVIDERLYLFYSDAARAAFLADPHGTIDRAARKWPEVARAVGH